MNNPLHIIAINCAKLSAFMSQTFKMGSGTSLPGMLAMKISPGLLKNLVEQTRKEKVFVTGTNGKTTTSGLIAGILQADQRKIAHNRKGANMLTGLVTAMAQASSITGKLDVDSCLLEIDEAYFPLVTEQVSPEVVGLTNLFRDQLDRYGELDTTAKKVLSGLEKIKDKENLIITVNADDPITSGVANQVDIKKLYYGIDSITYANQQENINSQREIATCACGKNFDYSKEFYSHLGHYYCSCGNKRQIPDVIATKVEINVGYSDISLVTPLGSFSLQLKMPGLYNVYNALCAITVAIALNIKPETIIEGIENYSTVFGRAETININDKDVLIQLIKNPVGATEVLKTVVNDPEGRLIIAINDNYADGRDVSWLWDAEFELLARHSRQILCSGVRASDMAVRLKYAGVKADLISTTEDIKTAILEMTEKIGPNERLYILPTYTVLLDMQLFLPKIVK